MQEENKERDIHKTLIRYGRQKEIIRDSKDLSEENKKIILKFLYDAELGKTVKHRQKKIIGPGRCLKFAINLIQLCRWLDNMPLDKPKLDKIEEFIYKLENNQILTKYGEPFKDSTKRDIKKSLKKFYKTILGNSEQYPDVVAWIDTYEYIPDCKSISLDEARRVAQGARTKDRAVIMTAFDAGPRGEELFNVKIEDVERTKSEEGMDYYKIWIKHPAKHGAKTIPRNVPCALCVKELDDWLALHPEKGNQQAYLFPFSYSNSRNRIKKLGEDIIGKKITMNVLRHSSATYHCHELNQYQLCKRMGWSLTSKQPVRYIDRQGIDDTKPVKVEEINSWNKLKGENEKLRNAIIHQSEQLDDISSENIHWQQNQCLFTLSKLMTEFMKDETIKTVAEPLLKDKGIIFQNGTLRFNVDETPLKHSTFRGENARKELSTMKGCFR